MAALFLSQQLRWRTDTWTWLKGDTFRCAHDPSTKRIGLNVVITKRDNKAIVQRSEVEADVAQANQVFAPDVEFYIASFEENDTINPVAVTDSIANERIFDAKPTLPLLYVVSYVKGGGGALPSGNGTFVTLDRGHALVAHELAHALGLSLTYNIDDFVADTGFAPASCTYTSECRNPSTCNNCRYASCPEASTNPSCPDA